MAIPIRRLGRLARAVVASGACLGVLSPAFAATSEPHPPAPIADPTQGIILPGTDPAPFYEDALVRYNRGDYANAIIQLKNALRANPEHLPARILIGQAHLRHGSPAEAEEAFNRALRGGADEILILPDLAQAYLAQRKFKVLFENIRPGARAAHVEAEIMVTHGLAHLEQQHMDEAARAFAAARMLDPTNPGPLLGQARIALGSNDVATAEDLTGRALTIDENDTDAWYVMGDIQRTRGDSAGAVEHYSRALELDPGHLQSRIARAATLIDNGDHGAAAADIELIRQFSPYDPQASYLRAYLLAQGGDQQGAQSILREAAQIMGGQDPSAVLDHPPSLLLSGVLNYAQGHYDEAFTYLDRFIKLAEHHAGARKMLGDILLRNGDPEEAVRVLEPAVQVAPDDAHLLTLLGRAYMRTSRNEDATRVFGQTVARSPDNADYRTHLATAHIAAGQRDRAIEELRAALALDPGATRAAVILARVHLQGADNQAALKVAAALAERQPNSAEAHNLTAAAHLGLGHRTEAQTALRRAITADPNFFPPYFNLARLLERDGDTAGATGLYNAILERERGQAQAMTELSRLAEAGGDYAAAALWLEKLRAIDPSNLAAQLRLLDLYLRADRPTAAIYLAQELEAKHPANAEVLMAKARAQLATFETSDAAATLRSAASVAARSPKQLSEIAQLQLAARDIPGARNALERALRVDSRFLAAQASLATLEEQAGNLDRALALTTKIRSAHPLSSLADVITGDVMMRTARYEEAAHAYLNGLRLQPSSALVTRLYGSRRAAGHKLHGLAELEAWLTQHPDDEAVQKALASAYTDNEQYAKAIEQHELLAARRPEDAAVLNNLAWLYQLTGDPRAIELAERAYALAPNSAGTIDTLGWVLVSQGQLARGLTLLREAHVRASSDAGVRYHLAVALNQLGRPDEAREQLEAALASDGAFVEQAAAEALLRSLTGARR